VSEAPEAEGVFEVDQLLANVQKLGASRFLRKPLRFDALYEALGQSLPESARPPR
jgi:hypothetical protein